MARKIEDMPINELEALITRLESQKERLSQCVAEMKSERGRVADELSRANTALARRQTAPQAPKVSAHALLRFIERVLEIGVALIEQTILSPANLAAIEAGATRITVDGIGLVIKDKVVVTVAER